MATQNPNSNIEQPNKSASEVNPAPKSQYANTERDDGTTANSRDRVAQQDGLADEDTPPWSPPENQPEPRPVDPILKPSQPAQTPNSPA